LPTPHEGYSRTSNSAAQAAPGAGGRYQRCAPRYLRLPRARAAALPQEHSARGAGAQWRHRGHLAIQQKLLAAGPHAGGAPPGRPRRQGH
nr:hypothetical protein [Tanacetum cinerariifolium]